MGSMSRAGNIQDDLSPRILPFSKETAYEYWVPLKGSEANLVANNEIMENQ